MEELLDQFKHFTHDNIALVYALLFISAFVENVFPPIPGDTVTLIGAYLVGTGKLSYSGVLVSTTLGSVVGFMTLFLVAYKIGKAFLHGRKMKWFPRKRLQQVEGLFFKYGYWIIAGNRFFSGIRSVISISAGLSRLNYWRVTVLSSLSALFWNGLLIYAGAFIGKSWQEIEGYIKTYNQIILIAFVVLGSSFWLYYYFFIFKRKN